VGEEDSEEDEEARGVEDASISKEPPSTDSMGAADLSE
jgi:hypothetical protein